MDAELALELLVQPSERTAQLGRGPDCAQPVVFVEIRNAEHRHDGVADELLHGAAVAFEHLGHPLEPPRHDQSQRLRVEPLSERRRIGHVCEEDGDRSSAYGHVLSVGLALRSA